MFRQSFSDGCGLLQYSDVIRPMIGECRHNSCIDKVGYFSQHRPAEKNQSCLESDPDSGDPLPPVRGCQRRSGEQRIPTDAGMYASKFVKALSSTLRPTHAAAADGTAIVFIGWTASPGSRTGTASGSASGRLSLRPKTIRNHLISDGFCNFFTCFLLGEISTTHTVTHTAK